MPMKVYIVMGVSGVGKTTIGKLLAARLKIPFFDADDYHPEESKVKMSSGIPLVDQEPIRESGTSRFRDPCGCCSIPGGSSR